MKKTAFKIFVSLCVVLSVSLFCICAFADSGLTLYADYNAVNQTLTVSGESEDFVIITVVGESVDYSSLYDSEPTEFHCITPTNGKYSFTFDISDAETSQKYTVSVTTYTSKAETQFICYSYEEAGKIFDEKLKGKSEKEFTQAFKENSYAFGIEFDPEMSDEFQAELLRLLYACNTQNGHSIADNYKKSYVYAALSLASPEDIETVISDNAYDLGIDFDSDWKQKVTEDIKDDILMYIADYDFAKLVCDSTMTFSDFADGIVPVFKASVVQSWLELKNLITDKYRDVFEDILSSKEYESIKNQDDVFVELLKYKSDFNSISDIREKLNDCIKKVKNREENKPVKKPTYGGGSGGTTSKIPTVSIEQGYKSPETDVPNTDNKDLPDSKTEFSDVSINHWCYNDIQLLSSVGIVNGYENSAFCPDNTVTRAEFVKMIVLALEINDSDLAEAPFDDVSDKSWFSPYVDSAFSAGIIKGDGNLFYPDLNLTREDAAVIVYRALYGNEQASLTETDFSDESDISAYALSAVASLSDNGIINGFEDGTFRPKNEITRAESVRILSGILKSEKQR